MAAGRSTDRPSVGTGGRRAGDGLETRGGKAPAFMIVFRVLGSNQGACCTSASTVAFGPHHPSRWDLFFLPIVAEAERDLAICTQSNS